MATKNPKWHQKLQFTPRLLAPKTPKGPQKLHSAIKPFKLYRVQVRSVERLLGAFWLMSGNFAQNNGFLIFFSNPSSRPFGSERPEMAAQASIGYKKPAQDFPKALIGFKKLTLVPKDSKWLQRLQLRSKRQNLV